MFGGFGIPSKGEYDNHSIYEFQEGFIHACLTKEYAKKLIEDYNSISEDWIIIEGYIPAYTRYALGIFNKGICARKIILNL